MNEPILYHSEAPVGNDQAFQARLISADGSGAIVGGEGNLVAPADVQSISCTVYDLQLGNAASTPIATPSITSSAITLLANDGLWRSFDPIGRNFLHQISGTVFAKADHTFRVVYKLTTTGGTNIVFAFEHYAHGVAPR